MDEHRQDVFLQEDELPQRKSLRDEVFEYLHKRIIAGRYAPGEWLRQEEISTLLGVSQTPVREALDLLVAAGLAERVPYRGVRVLQLSTIEIVDAYVMRLVLESAAARLAALNITEDQLAALRETLEKTRALITLDDMSTQRQLNKKFHLSMVAASGNSLLSKLYETVSNTFPDWMLYESMFRHPELLQESLRREFQEHEAIVDSIAARDAGLAAQHTLSHIHNLSMEFETFLAIPADMLRDRENQILPMLELTL